MLIEAIPFTSVGKLQPFMLTITSSSLLLADFHCHLTVREVCGYLGGTWDMNTHSESGLKIMPWLPMTLLNLFQFPCSLEHNKNISMSQYTLRSTTCGRSGAWHTENDGTGSGAARWLVSFASEISGRAHITWLWLPVGLSDTHARSKWSDIYTMCFADCL